jgi:hypothetical protein
MLEPCFPIKSLLDTNHINVISNAKYEHAHLIDGIGMLTCLSSPLLDVDCFAVDAFASSLVDAVVDDVDDGGGVGGEVENGRKAVDHVCHADDDDSNGPFDWFQ